MHNNNLHQTVIAGDKNINISGDFMVGGKITGNVISGDYVRGDKIRSHSDNSSTNNYQNLAQAAIEIQELLDKYSSIYNPNTLPGQEKISSEVVELISQNSTLKARIINAVREAGYAAIEESINRPSAKILMAALKSFVDKK